MKIFNVDSDEQEFEITPRYLAPYYLLKIINEDTQEETSYYTDTGVLPPIFKKMTTPTLDTVSILVGFDFEANNNETYKLTLYNLDSITNDIVLWRGKGFATSQVKQKYKINV
tara:strand:+ start:478 stop:816 length:339 start_codon:yes stop_codon:yes gene_type:complete